MFGVKILQFLFFLYLKVCAIEAPSELMFVLFEFGLILPQTLIEEENI